MTFFQQRTETAQHSHIDPATRLGTVHYTVADLERQIDFYQRVLNFTLHWREGREAALGAGKADLLRLTEQPGARRVRRTTGLYHTAFLVPTRWELAQLLRRIAETRTPIQGMTDHYTHLAIYLPDAEGNGIELAWDFPREKWAPVMKQIARDGAQALMNLGGPLEASTLFGELGRDPRPWDKLDPETQIGHVHLHVSGIAATGEFYQDLFGFDTVLSSSEAGIRFFSAGGYHHHIGTNIWNGAGAPPPPPDATGLRSYTVIVPGNDQLQQILERMARAGVPTTTTEHGVLLRDPARNGILLTTL